MMKQFNARIAILLFFFGYVLIGNQLSAATVTKTYQDNFETVSYANQDGTDNFNKDWQESQDKNMTKGERCDEKD